MPEAVIVSTARTPIGRAFKGSLTEARPDDMAGFIIDAARTAAPSPSATRSGRPVPAS